MSKNKPNKTSKVLRRGIARLERGWLKNGFHIPKLERNAEGHVISGTPQVCMRQAVNLDFKAEAYIAQAIRDCSPTDWWNDFLIYDMDLIMIHNDRHAENLDDVLKPMKLALIRAEADEAEEKLAAKGL